MHAVSLVDTEEITIREVDRPTLNDSEVLVRVAACGVCTTDYHAYHGTLPVETPLVLGHESAGIVTESNADAVAEGTRVAVNPTVPCNACSACKAGRTNLCVNNTSLGGAGDNVLDGAFAEYVRVPAPNVEPIGDLAFETAAFAEPLACAVHGVDRTGMESGDSVALLGAGPVGLLLIQTLRNRGAGQVVVSEPDASRREYARDLGADRTVDPTETVPDEVVEPVDVAIEAVGMPDTIEQAQELTGKGGTTLVFGVPPQDRAVEVNAFKLLFGEQDLLGTYSLTSHSFQRAVTLLRAGRVEVDRLVTHQLHLADLPTAFERIGRGEGLKQLVKP